MTPPAQPTGLILTPEQQAERMTQLRAQVEDLSNTVAVQAEALTAAESMINDLQRRMEKMRAEVDAAHADAEARRERDASVKRLLEMDPMTHVAKVQFDLRRRSGPIMNTAPAALADEIDGDGEDDEA